MDRTDSEKKDLLPLVHRAMANAEPLAAGCPDTFLLAQYIEKKLMPDEEAGVERHLVACHGCRQAVIAVFEAEGTCRGQSAATCGSQADLGSLLQELAGRCGFPDSIRPDTDVPHVMIVDDDQNYLHALEDVLRQDYRVTACSTGREALGRLSDGPRVIVLDIKMPGMDGFEVARRINRMKNAPAIIFNTAYPGQFQKDDIRKEHISFEYVTKDKPALLLHAIKKSCTGAPD